MARLPCGCCGQMAPDRRDQYQPLQGPCRGKKEGATHQSKVTASSLLFKEREQRIRAMEKVDGELLSFWLCSCWSSWGSMRGLDKTMYRVSQHTGHSAAVSNVNSSVVQETPWEQGQSAPEDHGWRTSWILPSVITYDFSASLCLGLCSLSFVKSLRFNF